MNDGTLNTGESPSQSGPKKVLSHHDKKDTVKRFVNCDAPLVLNFRKAITPEGKAHLYQHPIDFGLRSMLISRWRPKEGEIAKEASALGVRRGCFGFSGQPEREAFVIQQEVQLWRDRYRVLFEKNVAGTILTTPEGRIVDCNEACARIFGFDSREKMLAHSAWDLYFNRSEREILIDRLRTPGNNPAEEVCLRAMDGAPIWVLARRTVVSFVDGVPELLQGTFIDITAEKKAQARPRDVKSGQSSGTMSEGGSARISDLSQRIGNILRRVNKSLQPDNLSQIDRAEIQECFIALEQMKMLMSELEILHLSRE